MKKLFLVAAAAVFALSANAKVWRINYDENANADFRTITAACSSAKVANSDTLYCEAGSHAGSEGDNVISRKGLKVFGPGWGFEPQYGSTSTIADARFNAHVKIQANDVVISGIVCSRDLQLDQNISKNVTIKRCKLNELYRYQNDTLLNLTVTNCEIGRIYLYNGYSKQMKNIYITNNIIRQENANRAVEITAQDNQYFSNVNILRNTIVSRCYTSYSILNVNNALIQDNILINISNSTYLMDFSTDRGNIIRKNVMSLPDGAVETAEIVTNYPDNYYASATEASTFTCANSTYAHEQYYQLKDGSPAKGKAYDGGDCGAFGGSTPYIIGGRPQGIPYITDVEVPAQPKDNKLTVTFKVANQNE